MILITGWTGNTGSFVVRNVQERFPDATIVGISRSTRDSGLPNVIAEAADLADEGAVERIFAKYPVELVLHIANIRYSPLLLRLANTYRVPHIILVHTTGVYSKYRAYRALYQEIEQAVLRSPGQTTRWTILRPTMIYGNHRDHNMHKLIRFLARFPVFPIFGDGSAVMQPVHVEDLAAAIVGCIENPRVKNRAYNLSGGSVVTYRQVLLLITTLLRRKVLFVPVPHRLAVSLVSLYGRLVREPRITVEQVERLREDKSYSHEAAKADLGYHPRTFEEGIRQEIVALREAGVI